MFLTEAGLDAAQPPERPRTPRELQDRVIAMLGGASGKILEPLIAAYPHSMPRGDVADPADEAAAIDRRDAATHRVPTDRGGPPAESRWSGETEPQNFNSFQVVIRDNV